MWVSFIWMQFFFHLCYFLSIVSILFRRGSRSKSDEEIELKKSYLEKMKQRVIHYAA
jgi:hypothetical protein